MTERDRQYKVNDAKSIEVLRDSEKSGRTPKLDDTQMSQIKEVLQKEPELSGVTANIWDGKSLSFYIQKTYSIELGTRQCQRLFHQLGFSLKRARPTVCKSDPVKKEESKKNFKKN